MKLSNVSVFSVLFFLGFAFLHAQNGDMKQGMIRILPLPTDSANYLSSIVASFDGFETPIFQKNGKKYILVAADFDKNPGLYPLRVIKSNRLWYEIKLSITKSIFETVRLNTPYDFKTLPAAIQDSIQRAKEPLLQAIKKSDSSQLWEDSFGYPFDEIKITSSFGRTRIYNNGEVLTHRGVDLEATFGKPVHPVASGRVIWGEEKNFYSEGKIVVVDHGQGIVSMYMHLSKVMVKTGDLVSRETVIGKAGNTGHSFGAHLHLAIKVGSAFVDPILFIAEFQKIFSN